MEVIQREEQRIYVGGGDGTASNPYTETEYYNLLDSGLWTGGYVEGMGYAAGEAVSIVSGSYGTNNGSSGSYGSNDDWSNYDSDASIDSGFLGVIYSNYGINEGGSGSIDKYSWNFNLSNADNTTKYTILNSASELLGDSPFSLLFSLADFGTEKKIYDGWNNSLGANKNQFYCRYMEKI